MAKHNYLHTVLRAVGAPLSLWADQDNAGPYAIGQVNLIYATFGERLARVGINNSDAQLRTYRTAKFVWNAVCEIVEVDGYRDLSKLVKTTTKTVRKLWPKWSTTVEIKGAADFEREVTRAVRKALELPLD